MPNTGRFYAGEDGVIHGDDQGPANENSPVVKIAVVSLPVAGGRGLKVFTDHWPLITGH